MTRWIIGVVAVAAAAIVAIVLIATGGDDDSAQAGVASDQIEAYRDCLSENGVEMPEPPEAPEEGSPPSGVFRAPPRGRLPKLDEEQRQALEDCQGVMPTPEGGPAGPQVFTVPPQQ